MQDAIHAIAADPSMAWYNGGEHDRYTGMSAPIFDGGNGGHINNPSLYYLTLPILMQTVYTVFDANVSEVMRFRIGLFLHTMNMKNKSTQHRMHTDYDFPHQNMLYYVNDSDGVTTIVDWDDKEVNVEPKKGRIVLFPGSLMHCSHDPEHHHSRMVVNMNFMLEGVESERPLYRR